MPCLQPILWNNFGPFIRGDVLSVLRVIIPLCSFLRTWPEAVCLTDWNLALLPLPVGHVGADTAGVEAEGFPSSELGQTATAVPLQVSLGEHPVELQRVPGQTRVTSHHSPPPSWSQVDISHDADSSSVMP